jgi:hypothetical protein
MFKYRIVSPRKVSMINFNDDERYRRRGLANNPCFNVCPPSIGATPFLAICLTATDGRQKSSRRVNFNVAFCRHLLSRSLSCTLFYVSPATISLSALADLPLFALMSILTDRQQIELFVLPEVLQRTALTDTTATSRFCNTFMHNTSRRLSWL